MHWDTVAAYLSNHSDRLNRGNSLRTMKAYLEELKLSQHVKYKEGDYIITERGRRLLAEEEKKINRYLKPISFDKEVKTKNE